MDTPKKTSEKDPTGSWSFVGLILLMHFVVYKLYRLEIDLHGHTQKVDYTIRVIVIGMLLADMLMIGSWYAYDWYRSNPRKRVQILRAVRVR